MATTFSWATIAAAWASRRKRLRAELLLVRRRQPFLVMDANVYEVTQGPYETVVRRMSSLEWRPSANSADTRAGCLLGGCRH